MPPRVIMLLDLDYFFAQCEELRNPSLKDKPVVVCVYSGRTETSGAVSTANYIARKYSVKSGMPIFQAKKKLEGIEAIFLPVDYDYYERISNNVMNLLKAYADRFEQVGIDEAYIDVTERTNNNFSAATDLARKIKLELREQQRLTCSIGVGSNKLIAKIAADEQKPDGLTVIVPERTQEFLTPLSVNRLIGVGTKTKEKMQTLNINTVGDLARYDVQKLISVFGKTLGLYFHNIALGIDDDPVQEHGETESISRIATLKENTRDLNMVLEETNKLCSDIHSGIIQRDLKFRNIGIITVLADMSVHSRSKTLENATNDLAVLKASVKELFEKLLTDTELRIRRVGVRISGFEKTEKNQKQITSFFDQPENKFKIR